MKTHGHHTVAEVAGEPQLRQVLQEAFGTNVPLEAFYMGNWLTDVAQSFDPVAGSIAPDRIDAGVDWAFDKFPEFLGAINAAYDLASYWKPVDQQSFIKLTDRARAKVKAAQRQLFRFLTDPHNGGPPIYFKACQNGFFFKAYLKFVHPKKEPPENVSKPLRMDMGIFVQLFNEFFTQYWPHDHMDRPGLNYTPPPGTLTYDSRRPDDNNPGLYTYISEFAELAAVDLADIDLNWAREYLGNPPPASTLRTDFAFQRGLSNLGRALHSVEDFFAHSNYIEHAARVMGADYIPHFYQLHDYPRFLKRLIRLTVEDRDDNWQEEPQPPEEKHVVSGYFDFRDTAVSLLHLLEGPLMGILQRQPKDVTLELREFFDIMADPDNADNIIEREGDRVVADMLQVIKEPKKAYANEGNLFRQAIHQVYQIVDATEFADTVATIVGHLNLETPADDVNIAYFRNIMRHMPIFRELEAMSGTHINPDQILQLYSALLLYIRYLLIKRQIGPLFVSLLEIIESLLWWYFLPHKAVKKWLKRVAGEWIANRAMFYAKEKIYDFFAANRIGCHSLMSKDHGTEWLYGPMRNCATGAHYYIVKQILRWHDYRDESVPENQKYIDWDDVLRHIMEHPAKGVVYTIVHPVPTSFFHTLTEADMQRPWPEIFKEIRDQYSPTVLETMRTGYDSNRIIWGNVPNMISNMNPKAVREMALAGAISPALAMTLGLRRIIVPYIKYKIGVADPTKVNPRWYMPLMHMNWKPGRDLPTFNMRHRLRYHPNFTAANARAQRAAPLRNELEFRYQP